MHTEAPRNEKLEEENFGFHSCRSLAAGERRSLRKFFEIKHMQLLEEALFILRVDDQSDPSSYQ